MQWRITAQTSHHSLFFIITIGDFHAVLSFCIALAVGVIRMNLIKQLSLIFIIFLAAFSMAEDVKITIDVEDMTCSLCVTSINHSLRKTEGVIKAKASLKTHSVEVIAPKELNTDILLEAIKKTGYTGKIAQIEPIE